MPSANPWRSQCSDQKPCSIWSSRPRNCMGTNNPKTSMFPIESVSGPFVRSSDLADHLFRLRLRGRKRRLLCHVFDPTRLAVALLGDEPEVKVAHFFHQGQV